MERPAQRGANGLGRAFRPALTGLPSRRGVLLSGRRDSNPRPSPWQKEGQTERARRERSLTNAKEALAQALRRQLVRLAGGLSVDSKSEAGVTVTQPRLGSLKVYAVKDESRGICPTEVVKAGSRQSRRS